MYTLDSALPELLLPWYREYRRQLPWREDPDPYHIWISEIMLQQTRVEAVRGYYVRFLEVLPNVQALSECEDEKLHKLWEGLGYYSRVRNLKKAAQIICSDYGGCFPKKHGEVLALPGIGEYTAGAICSIAFNLPTPAVDGNVLRVCSRLTNDFSPIDLPETKKKVREALERIYPAQAGEFTQALMELGATICGPNRKPDCALCPCREICSALHEGTAQTLPVKSPKQEKRQEDRTVFIFSCGGSYALAKRPNRGLLAGLWEFPNVSGKLEISESITEAEKMGLSPSGILRQVERKHIFTHIQWNLRGIYMEVQEPTGAFHWVTAETLDREAALPTAFRQFLEEINNV